MQTVHWRIAMDVARRYEDLVAQLSWLDVERDHEEYTVLKEEIQMLPGFPRVDDWQNTTIVPVVDKQRDYHFLR